MKDDSTTKANGNGSAKPVSQTKVPAKKGRVGAIVDAEKKNRRRSSLGGGITLGIPQIPSMAFSCEVGSGLMAGVAKPRKAVFMFGNGDMGQLGLGPDTLDEIPRPRIHAW
jgi:regulator of chromosome condensation